VKRENPMDNNIKNKNNGADPIIKDLFSMPMKKFSSTACQVIRCFSGDRMALNIAGPF
jgi:hypothetical protein